MKKLNKFVLSAVAFSVLSLFFLSASAEAQEFRVRGRLHMDAFYGISDADDFSNGFNNRRGRMGMSGTITNGWDGQIEIDFADGTLSHTDTRLRRTFENGGRLLIGQFKVPMGHNELTSSNSITFMERSTPTNVIADARRLGIGYELYRGNLGFNSMVFGRSLGERAAIAGNMPLGAAFRGVFSPELAGGTLHLGGSIAYQHFSENRGVRYRDRPGLRDSKGGSLRLIDVTVPDAESTLKTGIEILWLSGPFSVDGEYLRAAVNSENGNNAGFHGWYIQSGYVLTGESRSYSRGVAGGVTPAGEKGAWEVAVRYTQMNLNDGEFTGGEQSNITLGLNHYVTSRLRFMVNLVYVTLDNTDTNPLLGGLRAQFNF